MPSYDSRMSDVLRVGARALFIVRALSPVYNKHPYYSLTSYSGTPENMKPINMIPENYDN